MGGYLLGNALTSVSYVGYRPAGECLPAPVITVRIVPVPAVLPAMVLPAHHLDRR